MHKSLSQFVQGIFISNSGDQAHSMSGNGMKLFSLHVMACDSFSHLFFLGVCRGPSV